MFTLPLILALTGTVGGFHVPHDNVHDVAWATMADGSTAILIVTNNYSKVLRSNDGGLTWFPVAGDGLGQRSPRQVEFHQPASGPALFFIGTDAGVYAYEPQTGVVQDVSFGIGGHRSVISLSAPLPGSDGPLALAVSEGEVFLWDSNQLAWTPSLITNLNDPVARVAVAPQFDSTASPGPERTLLAAFNGRLHVSLDGGGTWNIHPAFPGTATGRSDDWITALAFDREFLTSGIIMVGTGDWDLNPSSGQTSRLWRSTDFGATFSQVNISLPGPVCQILSTPPGPSGSRDFFAACLVFPNVEDPETWVGVLRSDDLGNTWNDFGNWQDFFLGDFGTSAVPEPLHPLITLAFNPDYVSTGELLFGRAEGFYFTNDRGNKWRQLHWRIPQEIRELDSAIDPSGNTLIYAGCYGAGTIRYDLGSGEVNLLGANPVTTVRPVVCSPSFSDDGTVFIGGWEGISAWFEYFAGGDNPFGGKGWFDPPANPDYIRSLALSRDFDGRQGSADQSILWSSYRFGAAPRTIGASGFGSNLRSLNTMEGGIELPNRLWKIEFTSAFDPNDPNGWSGIYAIVNKQLIRLENDIWKLVWTAPTSIQDFALVPDFSASDPRIFLALYHNPCTVLVEDGALSGGSVTATNLPQGDIEDWFISDLDLPPDFGIRPVVYVSTWGGGIWKLDLSSALPAWEPVGGEFPPLWSDSISLLPGFETHRQMAVGTHFGLVTGADLANAPWKYWDGVPVRRDDYDPGFRFFDPSHPDNTQPDRVWPWEFIRETHPMASALSINGREVKVASRDGAWLDAFGIARKVAFHTWKGPGAGTVHMRVEDPQSGALLNALSVDLDAPYPLEKAVVIGVGSSRPVRVVAEMALDSGEIVLFDGMTFLR